jgi:hypothetical protein
MTDAEYLARELARLGPDDQNVDYRVKFTSDGGQTRWLSITPEQFRALARVLTTEESRS